ncbi:MAG: hypothetical protein IJ309_01345 [Clostridia bacterium]|nr:hypothetical protein [Clostridia bacterium]
MLWNRKIKFPAQSSLDLCAKLKGCTDRRVGARLFDRQITDMPLVGTVNEKGFMVRKTKPLFRRYGSVYIKGSFTDTEDGCIVKMGYFPILLLIYSSISLTALICGIVLLAFYRDVGLVLIIMSNLLLLIDGIGLLLTSFRAKQKISYIEKLLSE